MPMIIASKRIAPMLGLFFLGLIISLSYGFQYRFADGALDNYFLAWTVPWFLALVGLTAYALRGETLQLAPPPIWLGVLFCATALALTCFFYLSKVAPVAAWVACAVFPAMLSLILSRRYPKFAIALLVATGVAVNLYLIAVEPHTSGANMLEIIEAAAADFLAGNNPYHDFPSISHLPFGYPPGLWLPYVPFVWLGLDTRILNVLIFAFIIWLFWKHMGLQPSKRAPVLGIILFPILLSPFVTQMLVHGHVWPYWAGLMVMVVMLWKERYLAAAIVFGLLLATRQPAIWLAFPLAGFLASKLGVKDAIRHALISLAVFLTVLTPFALTSEESLVRIMYFGISDFHTIQPHLSAEGWLKLIDARGWLRPLQILVLVASMVWLYFKRVSLPTFLMVAGLVYAWVVFFNVYAVRYVYLPGIFLFAAGLTLKVSSPKQ